jgi:hypothetical protein
MQVAEVKGEFELKWKEERVRESRERERRERERRCCAPEALRFFTPALTRSHSRDFPLVAFCLGAFLEILAGQIEH